MLTRRAFLAALGSLPIVGRWVPQPKPRNIVAELTAAWNTFTKAHGTTSVLIRMAPDVHEAFVAAHTTVWREVSTPDVIARRWTADSRLIFKSGRVQPDESLPAGTFQFEVMATNPRCIVCLERIYAGDGIIPGQQVHSRCAANAPWRHIGVKLGDRCFWRRS